MSIRNAHVLSSQLLVEPSLGLAQLVGRALACRADERVLTRLALVVDQVFECLRRFQQVVAQVVLVEVADLQQ